MSDIQLPTAGVSITVADVLSEVNKTMRANFSGMKIYGKEIKEGHERPSFFVEVEDKGTELYTKNVSLARCNIAVYYFQPQKGTRSYSESENLIMAARLQTLFGTVIAVKDRHITVSESVLQYEDDIMQMVFSLAFYVENKRDELPGDLIESVELEELEIKKEV